MLACFTTTVEGQTLGGRVTDRASRRPAQAVMVSFVSDSDVALARATTDTAGVFYLKLPEPAHGRLQFVVAGLPALTTDTMTMAAGDFIEREYLMELPRVYTRLNVGKQAVSIPGTTNLYYPSALREARVGGDVIAQFVVDAEGRVRLDTFRALRSTHPAFTEAVREGLRSARFYPAEVAGRKVAQLVEEPFTFAITVH